jgi:O-antigen/teichoic acid export membrane protein
MSRSDLTGPDATVTEATAIVPVGRFRSHLSMPMYRTAYALLLNTGITSLLGLLYWAVAAHHYPAAEVGEASSAISALQLLSGVAQCNLNNALPRLIPKAGTGTAKLVLRSYAVAVGMSIVLASGFALLAAHFGWAGGFLTRGSGYVIWFVLAVAVWSVFFLEDSVLAGLRQAVWVPVENTSFSLGKILLLLVFAGITLHFGIFGSFTIPVAIAVLPVNWLIFAKLIPRHQARPIAAIPTETAKDQTIRTYLAGEYVGGLANLATTTLLPILVASQVGSVANAYFYSAWVVGSSFEYVLSSIAVSLVVEGANDTRRAGWVARRGALMCSVVLLPAIGLTIVAAPVVLKLVGHGYAAEGTIVLRLVALAVLPRAIISLSVANARIHRDIRAMVTIQVSACVLTIGLAAGLLPQMGLRGAGIAYLAAQGAVALPLLPRLYRLLWPGGEEIASPGGDLDPEFVGAVSLDAANAEFQDQWRGPTGSGVLPPLATLGGAALAVAVAVLTGLGAHLALQPLIAVAFLLWSPGAAVISFFDVKDRLIAVVLAVAVSLAIGTLGAEAMIWTGTWHPRGAIVGLAVASAAILVGHHLGRRRRGSHTCARDRSKR